MTAAIRNTYRSLSYAGDETMTIIKRHWRKASKAFIDGRQASVNERLRKMGYDIPVHKNN